MKKIVALGLVALALFASTSPALAANTCSLPVSSVRATIWSAAPCRRTYARCLPLASKLRLRCSA